MFNYSNGMPMSLSMVYGVQDKFIELKFFMIAVTVWIGVLLFYSGHTVSVWGFIFLAGMIGLIINCIRKVKDYDSSIITEKNIDFIHFYNDGKITCMINGKKEEDTSYHQMKFKLLPNEIIREVVSFWKHMEKVHLLEMEINTPSNVIKSGKYKFIYYSRRSFLLPHLYQLSQQKRVAKLGFVDKIKVDANKLKGQDFITMSVRSNKNPIEYLKPPFISNAGRIMAEDGGVKFVLGFKTVQVKYENIELYAYPSTIDDLVDYELIFNGESYMFKMGQKYNRHLIPHYENNYEKNFFDNQ